MAQFNIDASLSNGKRLNWLAVADRGESPADVVCELRRAAERKFGAIVRTKRWTHQVASNGYITVQMFA